MIHKTSKIFVFPTIRFSPDDRNNDASRQKHCLWTSLIPTVMFGLHRDVHVALKCCLLDGHSAGGNRHAEGTAKEHSPPRTCSSAVTWWEKSSMFFCRVCDSPDKTLTRGTGWSLLNLTSNWTPPSPVTCDKQQPAGNTLFSSATQTSFGSLSFSPIEPSKTVCCGSFGHLGDFSLATWVPWKAEQQL